MLYKKLFIVLSILFLSISCDTISVKHAPAKHKPARHAPTRHIPTTRTPINYQTTFAKAKKESSHIFSDMKTTFYCGCEYDNHKKVDRKSCGYVPKNNSIRAQRIEWEHIVPASRFGKQMKSHCWDWNNPKCVDHSGKRFGGRECCLQTDKTFSKMHNDLHNLVPAIGEINRDRQNYDFGYVFAPTYNYGTCQIKIHPKKRLVEPNNFAKGVVARTHLYYNKHHKMPLSKREQTLFNKWNKKYPPTQWEKTWNQRVARIQGNYNLYIG